MKIGIVGCGNISDIYLKNLTSVFNNTEVFACADLDEQKALAKKEQYAIPFVMTLDEMLECKDIDLILNITTPQSHYSITKKALMAGKHVYVEKPLALNYSDGKELVELALKKGLWLGCAPDTFLGAGIQTCENLINEGKIGKPVAAGAYMLCHGHESWHPSPEFYYDIGGGPLFDMGPYYITALVRLLGRAESVTACCGKAFKERTITSSAKYGKKIDVKVDTHNAGIIKFENGAIVTLVTSFDVWGNNMPKIEIYGTEGSLCVPDPNTFGGPVSATLTDKKRFENVDLYSPYCANSRGLGISEMVLAISEGRINNASGLLALHVLEIMESIIKSSKEGKTIILESSPSQPVALNWDTPIGNLKTLN